MGKIDARLKQLGHTLPEPMDTGGLPFQLVKIHGDRAYVAGHVPIGPDGTMARPLGKVGTDVTPEQAGWKMLGFRVRKLPAGERLTLESQNNELCLVFLGGDATVKVGGETWRVQGRRGVFAGLPYSVYVPPDIGVEVQAEGQLEFAVG